jgi:AraC-like DNA-binding protein
MIGEAQTIDLARPHPAIAGRTISSAWMRGLANTLTAQGLDAGGLFRDAGLSIAQLEDCEHRWPSEQVSRLWTLAAERSGNPAIALSNPHLARPDHYGVVGYAMMSSSDLLTGLERLIRYLCIVGDAASVTLDPGQGGRWVRIEFFGGNYPVPRQRYEYALLTLLTFCRWMVGRALKPVVAAFSHPAPEVMAPYQDAFGCPFEFEAQFNGFMVSDADLATKLPTAAPELAEIHARIAGLALLKLGLPETAHRARAAVARRLQDGTPLRSTIAADIGLSDHTLRRRLTDEGTSFAQLVEDTRRELAQHHLTDLKTSYSEIAYLLGYSDQSTFFRACIRWFGESPGEYRARVWSGNVSTPA